MTVQAIFDAIDSGMAEVSRRLASGELDQSGRHYTDEELAAGAATGTGAEAPRRVGVVGSKPKKRRAAVSG